MGGWLWVRRLSRQWRRREEEGWIHGSGGGGGELMLMDGRNRIRMKRKAYVEKDVTLGGQEIPVRMVALHFLILESMNESIGENLSGKDLLW